MDDLTKLYALDRLGLDLIRTRITRGLVVRSPWSASEQTNEFRVGYARGSDWAVRFATLNVLLNLDRLAPDRAALMRWVDADGKAVCAALAEGYVNPDTFWRGGKTAADDEPPFSLDGFPSHNYIRGFAAGMFDRWAEAKAHPDIAAALPTAPKAKNVADAILNDLQSAREGIERFLAADATTDRPA